MTRWALEGFDGGEGRWRSLGAPRGRNSDTMAGSRESQHIPGMVSRSAYAQHEIFVGKRWWKGQTDWLVRILSVRLKYYHFHPGDRPLIDILGAEKWSPSELGSQGAPSTGGEVGGR